MRPFPALAATLFLLSLVPAQAQVKAPVRAAATAADAWAAVPPMDWTNVRPTDFADNELDIPYLLEHFSRIANAVVETGPDRGFLDIKVARDPKDNAPYNARVMEGHLALSYFYCVKRPWNPYYGSPALKQRLEAMLSFWATLQGPDGRFSEYKPGGWGLAPTGFGVRAMSQTLELLHAGGPTIDPAILKRTMAVQRKGIMSMLTLEQNLHDGHTYSNQFSGVYEAALSYMALQPDPEMKTALEHAVLRAVAEHQSPAGFMYEWDGSDNGYSGVHDNNLRLAWRDVQNEPIVRDALLKESENWYRWLSYDLVRQPDGTYLSNSGVNTRTTFSAATDISRPVARQIVMARAFSPTAAEWKQQIAARRAVLAKDWPHFKPLVVPSAYSYDFGGFLTAVQTPDTWFPTAAQKASALAALPYLARSGFVHQANDPRPYGFTFVRHPSYYAIFNTGKIRRPGLQVYGLGLLWSGGMGGVLQSVAQTPWMWGTRPEGASAVEETKDLLPQMTVGGQPLSAKPGLADYPEAPVTAAYALDNGGQKTVLFDDTRVSVTIRCPGGFQEMLPLLKHTGDVLSRAPGRLVLRHGREEFIVTYPPDAELELLPGQPFLPGVTRLMAVLKAEDRLTYGLSFNER